MRVDILHKILFKKALSQVCPELKITACTGITIDSRKVQRGDIFLALKGESTDGHHYIKQAQNAGAAICIVEKESDRFDKKILSFSKREEYWRTASKKFSIGLFDIDTQDHF